MKKEQKFFIMNWNWQDTHHKEEKAPAVKEKGIAVKIGTIFTVIGAIAAVLQILIIIISNIFASAETSSGETPVYEQGFYSEYELNDSGGIQYIEYAIASEPLVKGYYVKTYPYLLYTEEGTSMLIPLKNMFRQEEYIADSDGICRINAENIIEDLKEAIKGCTRDSPDIDMEICTLLAISYTENNEEVREFYVLSKGKLRPATEDIQLAVLSTYDNPAAACIDLWLWPKNKEQLTEFISKIRLKG